MLNSTSERICVICQSVCSPQVTVDDLMKLKLKHLRSILNTANVATSNCKEKRDLVDLILRNRFKFQNVTNNNNNKRTSTPPNTASPSPPPSSTNQQSSNSFNDTFSNFMTNVQDFVNFNLNSALNQAQPAPAPPSSSSSSSTSSTTTNKQPFTSTTSTNFNINQSNSSQTPPSSSSSHHQMPSSSTASNLNNLFNIIGEQVPNVLQQTFTNNRFTFNNVFNSNSSNDINNIDEMRRGSTVDHSEPEPTANTTTPTTTTTTINNEPPPPTTTTEQKPTTIKRRASLSDIKTVDDIENLSIKQIKEILATNFVDYKGCCEKKELIEKAKRLFNSYEDNKRLEKELVNESTNNGLSAEASGGQTTTTTVTSQSAGSETKKVDEFDLCKICMESLIDCVLLDCGHMVACTKCGKRLAECPICRQNVIRVIRVFKS